MHCGICEMGVDASCLPFHYNSGLFLFQFLERCTSMLDLPFAARRLFDETGQEHFSLRNLKRDQLVYVSCGEAWAEPKLSKGEQQRRYLLNNLASDVKQMQQFIALRKAQSEYREHACCLYMEGGGGLSKSSG